MFEEMVFISDRTADLTASEYVLSLSQLSILQLSVAPTVFLSEHAPPQQEEQLSPAKGYTLSECETLPPAVLQVSL